MIHFFCRLWQIHPRLINNPVIMRELVVRLRNKSSFGYLAVFLLVGVIIVSIFWSLFQQNYYRGASWNRQIREMFTILNAFQGVIVSLLIPLLSATIVSIERERETWDILRTTPLNLATIIFGKFFSSVLFVWILLSSLIPIYGMFLTSGGVSPNEITVVFLLFAEMIVVIGLIGLYCSIRCKRTIQAISWTYILGFIYVIGIFFIRTLICAPFMGDEEWGVELFVSPAFVMLIYFTNVGTPPGVGGFAKDHPYQVHIILVAILIAVLLYLCYRALSRHGERLATQGFFMRFVERFRRTSKSGFLRRWPPRRYIPLGKNPIYYKDKRELAGQWRLPISIGFLFFLGLFVYASSIDMNRLALDQLQFMLVCTVFAPWTVVPYAANSIRGEFDRNTFELLRTTTLTSQQIIDGKFRTGVSLFKWRFWSFFLLPCIGFFLSGQYWDYLFGSLIVLFVSSRFFLTAGIFCSSLKLKTLTVYALTFGAVLFFYFIIPGMIGLLCELAQHEMDAAEILYPVGGILSPFFLIVNYGSRNWQWDGAGWVIMIALQCLWMTLASNRLTRFTHRNIRLVETV